MVSNTIKWITDNFALWQKICRTNHNAFDEDKLCEVMQTLLHLSKQNPEFEIILIVFFTVYENELPFFRSSNTP